jgi:hypothetical protein
VRAARKLPRIATHTIEPRGPFTLAFAARFIERRRPFRTWVSVLMGTSA